MLITVVLLVAFVEELKSFFFQNNTVFVMLCRNVSKTMDTLSWIHWIHWILIHYIIA